VTEELNGVENNPVEATPPTPISSSKNYDKRRRVIALTAVPVLLAASLIVSIPIAVIYMTPNIPVVVAILATLAAEFLALAWAIWYGKLTPLKDFLYLRLPKWWYIPVGIVAGILGYVILQLGAMATTSIFGAEVGSSDTSTQLGNLQGFQAFIVLIGLVAVLGPVTEEFYFRGIIVGALQNSKWNKPWIAIVVSGVSFGLMHFQGAGSVTDIFVLLWTMTMGFGFAWLLLKTKSIWTPVAAHVAYNAVTAIILLSGFEG